MIIMIIIVILGILMVKAIIIAIFIKAVWILLKIFIKHIFSFMNYYSSNSYCNWYNVNDHVIHSLT